MLSADFNSISNKMTRLQNQFWHALQQEFSPDNLPVLLKMDELSSSAPKYFLFLKANGFIETEHRAQNGIELIWVCRDEQDWLQHVKRKELLASQFPPEKRQTILSMTTGQLHFWMKMRRKSQTEPMPFTFKASNKSGPNCSHVYLHRLRKAGLIETHTVGIYGTRVCWICQEGDIWKPPTPSEFLYARRSELFKVMPAAMSASAKPTALHRLESMNPQEQERYERICLQGSRSAAAS